MKKAVKIIFDILTWILLILAFIVTVLVISSDKNNGTASLFGYMPFTVESDSMKPEFSKGDLVLDKEIDDIHSLKEGDVITFWTMAGSQRIRNTHRIVAINDNGGALSFTTKGDNNPINDTTDVNQGDIIGKWTGTKLGGAGKAMDFLRTRKGFFICIIIPMGIFFIFELYKLIVVIIEMKRPEPLTESDEEEIKRRAIEEYLAEQKKKESEGTDNKQENSNNTAAAPENFKNVSEAAEKLTEETKKTSSEPESPAEETTASETEEKPSDENKS